MTIASGANVGLSYVAETTHGTTPGTPTMLTLRTTGKNINLQKNTLQSSERRSDRQIATVRHGFNQVVGNPGFELSLIAYDDMLQAALSGTWAAVTTGTATITAAASGKTFTRSTGSYLTDGFAVGDIVTPAVGTNTTEVRITALSALVLTTDSTIADHTGVGSESIAATGKKLEVGSTLRTFTFERRFTDVAQYQVFRGVAVNSLSLNVQPEQIVGGTIDLLGMSAAAMSGSSLGSPTAAASHEPFSAFDGTLWEADTAIAVVTGISFQLQNNRALAAVVGSQYSPDVFEGDCVINGTLTAMFENATMFNKFVNETASSIDIKMDDLDGTNWMRFRFDNVKYMGGDMDPPQSGHIPISMPFQALVSATTGTSMVVQRSNA